MDKEIGEQCLALALIRSLNKKDRISNETMKAVERVFSKNDCDS